MKDLIEAIRNKSNGCNIDTKDGRIRKSAYVDCIIMIQEWEKVNSVYPVLAEVRAISLQAIKPEQNDDYMDYQYGRELKQAMKIIYKKVSEHFS